VPAGQSHRTIVVGHHHDLLQQRRREQQTEAFKERMQQRGAIEGTISELARAHGLRRSRYRGFAKVELQNLLIGTACNVKRWLRIVAETPMGSKIREHCPESIRCVLCSRSCQLNNSVARHKSAGRRPWLDHGHPKATVRGLPKDHRASQRPAGPWRARSGRDRPRVYAARSRSISI
jgi:hypothetical protein